MEEKYEYTPLYYGTPCQVRFYDGNNPDDVVWHGGIAYHDYIICGCSGAILKIDDIIKDAEKAGIHFEDAVVEYGDWVDISEFIKGK